MANIQYGPLAQALAGSVAGVTFQRAGSQSIVRGKPKPARPQKALQRATQGLFAEASSEWRVIGNTAQDNWRSYAATVTLTNSLGQTYNPTGQQCFIWAYVTAKNCGIATFVGGPSGTGTPAEHAPTFGMSGTVLRLESISPDADDLAGMFVNIYYPDTTRAQNRMPLLFHAEIDVTGVLAPWDLIDTATDCQLTNTRRRIFMAVRYVDNELRTSLLYKYFYDVPL